VLRFGILGPLEVVGEHGRIELGGAKQRATFAILLLNASRVVSIDRLADELYAGAAPATALKQVQRQISELRKLLGPESGIETRTPGYLIRLGPEQLDLTTFERLAADATEAFEAGDATRAADLLRRALALWRGAPLADLTYESFARASIERLEEIRLAALEQRVEVELALGLHTGLVGELEQLVAEHPLRERFREQLMLALYRSGRQTEALEGYRAARRTLRDDFGLEPAPTLQQLERRILSQDPSLELDAIRPKGPSRGRSVLVVASDEEPLDALLSLAEPLARLPGSELIIARLVADELELSDGAASANARRAALGVNVRAAAFTTDDAAADAVRLGTAYDVDLVLANAASGIEATPLPDAVATLLEGSPADVALCGAKTVAWEHGSGVFVPFGGAEHDWSALELGAWLASAAEVPLRLVGLRGDAARGQRDASRLLANASLAVQQLAGVNAEPLLVAPAADALVEAVDAATLVCVGISPRWRTEGIGAVRQALSRDARPAVVFVHGGPRPGGLAPRDARTRFSWSLEA
jgi:DNA-binding SARP family transcriptional activator